MTKIGKGRDKKRQNPRDRETEHERGNERQLKDKDRWLKRKGQTDERQMKDR